MKRKILYIGLDVHKNTIDVAVATGRANGKVWIYPKLVDTSKSPMYMGNRRCSNVKEKKKKL
jgi:hypothetical protein